MINQDDDASTKKDDNSRRGSIKFKQGDDRKRAFSLSKQSTQQLGKSLQKKRGGLKHLFAGFLAFFYSIFLILFKLQPKPQKGSNYFVQFLLALLVSTDLLVNLSFAFHLVYPDFGLSHTMMAYIFIYPGLPIISPILGLLSVTSISKLTYILDPDRKR